MVNKCIYDTQFQRNNVILLRSKLKWNFTENLEAAEIVKAIQDAISVWPIEYLFND